MSNNTQHKLDTCESSFSWLQIGRSQKLLDNELEASG